MSKSNIKYTSQHIDNQSFDDDFQVSTTELIRRNAGGTAIEFFNPATEEKQDTQITILDTQATLYSGAKSSIGVSALQMTTTSVPTKKGVLVKASDSNTGIVYVGKSGVTAGTVDATDGFELWAGEAITIPVANANLIYVIASATAQKVFWVAL